MRWVLVSGGFHKRSGMGRASYELAKYLLIRGDFVEVVSYEVDRGLQEFGRVKFHVVPLPLGSHLLAEFALGMAGKKAAKQALREDPSTRVLTCGGNCDWPDINWVHSLHHAWKVSDAVAPPLFRLKSRLAKRMAKNRESRTIPHAKLVITNSERTRQDVIKHLHVESSRVHTVYLGSDQEMNPPTLEERLSSRKFFNLKENDQVALFVGALGYDANKGFDTLLAAWSGLIRSGKWGVKLLAAGSGRGMELWENKIKDFGLNESVRLLGFTNDVPKLLAAGDLLVSPVRYESYGLNVHEAIQRGIPAIVSSTAGVAERYPSALLQMLLNNPDDVNELCDKLNLWKNDSENWKIKFSEFQKQISSFSWSAMSEKMVKIILNG